MATLTFSPPIIKLVLLLILAVATFAVTAWMIRKDVREMAERAEREWGKGKGGGRDKEKAEKGKENLNYHPMNGRTNGVVSSVKTYDHRPHRSADKG